MEDNPIDTSLLLPDLFIENFRGIKNLSIPRLARVTLLAGKNGVGKTTVLEAVEVFAGRGRYTVLRNILSERNEVSYVLDENSDRHKLHEWKAIFHGREIGQNVRTKLGPRHSGNQLSLEAVPLAKVIRELEDFLGAGTIRLPLDSTPYVLRALFQGREELIPALITVDRDYEVNISDSIAIEQQLIYMAGRFNSTRASPIKCERIGDRSLKAIQLLRFWKHVVLRDDESQVIEALKIAYGEEVVRVSVISDEASSTTLGGQRAVVKLKSQPDPVPLHSLGGGATRLFGIALALAYCRRGILLIDEAENGIHHSVQRDYWRMVLQTARENNVQVFATTHSWDCARGFAQAATENEDVEGVLVRLETEDEGLRAVRYDERRLKIAAEQGVEVR